MINHHMILEGIKYGLIQFKVDPNLERSVRLAITGSTSAVKLLRK